jgi:hypothetical protein
MVSMDLHITSMSDWKKLVKDTMTSRQVNDPRPEVFKRGFVISSTSNVWY